MSEKRASLPTAPVLHEPANTVASNPSIERTFQKPRRALWPAAHVEH